MGFLDLPRKEREAHWQRLEEERHARYAANYNLKPCKAKKQIIEVSCEATIRVPINAVDLNDLHRRIDALDVKDFKKLVKNEGRITSITNLSYRPIMGD